MLPHPYDVFHRYKSKGVLVDSNLLLLVAIGTHDLGRVGSGSRTAKYTAADFTLVTEILAYFDKRVTTPNILTEVDNMARQDVHRREYEAISVVLHGIVHDHFEVHRPASPITETDLFNAVGLTDSITIALSDELLVLTDDFGLWGRIVDLGNDAFNINHIRTFDL